VTVSVIIIGPYVIVTNVYSNANHGETVNVLHVVLKMSRYTIAATVFGVITLVVLPNQNV